MRRGCVAALSVVAAACLQDLPPALSPSVGQCQGALRSCVDPDRNRCETDTRISRDHCGACGHGCLGGECVAGVCQPVVIESNQTRAHGIAVDDVAVYWTTEMGRVGAQLHAGGTPLKLFAAEGASAATGVVAAGGKAFFGLGVPMAGPGALYSVRPVAGSAAKLADVGQLPLGLALDGSSLFWTDRDKGTVMEFRVDGAPDGGARETTWVSGHTTPTGIAVDGGYLYWTNASTGAVMRLSRAGGVQPVGMARNPTGYTWGIAVDDAFVYWREADPADLDGRVMKLAKGAVLGQTPVVLAEGYPGARYLALDATHVYWTTFLRDPQSGVYTAGRIARISKDGGPVQVLATSQQTPHGIAVDDQAIYWTNFGGSVMKLAKQK